MGLFRQMLRGLRFNQTPGNIDRMDKNAPILLIAGQDDPVGDMGAGVRRTHDAFKRAGIRDVTLKLYPGCGMRFSTRPPCGTRCTATSGPG